MAGKARVHELAKELNVTSKDILQKLSEIGEFVKSASSTVEAPVARRLREQYAGSQSASVAKKPEAKTNNTINSNSTPKKFREHVTENESPVQEKTTFVHSDVPPKNYSENKNHTEKTEKPAFPKPGRPQRGINEKHKFSDSSAPSTAHRPHTGSPAPTGNKQPSSSSSPKPNSIPRPQQRVANNPYSTSNARPPRPGGQPGHNNRSHNNNNAPGIPRPRPQGSGPGANRPSGGARNPHPGAGHPPRTPGPRPGGSRPGNAGGSKNFTGNAPSPSSLSHSASRSANTPDTRRTNNNAFPSGGNFGGVSATPTASGMPANRGGRPGRGGTGGAFGRQGNNVSGGKKSRKSKKQKRSEFDMMEAPELGGVRLPRGEGQVIRLARGASLSDFAEKINANPASLVQALFKLGEMVTATQSVSEDTLQLLGAELNFDVQVVSPEDEDRELLENFDLSFGENIGSANELELRAPVVAVMGHVDHGKTRLLDTIRKANVRDSEAGGITQHIGAYQVTVPFEDTERPVTFIDTPGHEAFTAMRARGAQVTDIAVLVVAADDGVMPQTVEAINHAQAAGVPIVVAVNKIDKEAANPEKIRSQLTEFNLVAEEYGGQTIFVDISAMKGTNIDKLLEAILLTADAELELTANPNMPAQGVAIEAHLDRGRGPVATVLIQRGTLNVGDSVVAGDAYGRVRRMVDEHGADVEAAIPSRPVQVIGFTSVPGAGDNLLVVEEDRIARQIADRRSARKRNALQAKAKKRISLEDLDSVLKETSQLNLILKGDNAGTVEALEETLLGLSVDDEVQLRVIDRGVGGVTETNVNLAAASDAIIIAFNVRNEGKASELAAREGVEIRYYSVIYQAVEDVEKALKGMLKPIYEEKEIGKAEIREIFKSSKVGVIAGCLVIDGLIRRNAKARLIRDSSVVHDAITISSLRREKDDVVEVRNGFECGIVLSYADFKIGDIIESYELVEKPRL